jgi:hypothetical protein
MYSYNNWYNNSFKVKYDILLIQFSAPFLRQKVTYAINLKF